MQKYDVIVVGAGNGGLSAATYLATAGKKSIICPAAAPQASAAAITNLRQRSMSSARWATEKKAVPAAP